MSSIIKTFHFSCLNLCNNHVDQSTCYLPIWNGSQKTLFSSTNETLSNFQTSRTVASSWNVASTTTSPPVFSAKSAQSTPSVLKSLRQNKTVAQGLVSTRTGEGTSTLVCGIHCFRRCSNGGGPGPGLNALSSILWCVLLPSVFFSPCIPFPIN